MLSRMPSMSSSKLRSYDIARNYREGAYTTRRAHYTVPCRGNPSRKGMLATSSTSAWLSQHLAKPIKRPAAFVNSLRAVQYTRVFHSVNTSREVPKRKLPKVSSERCILSNHLGSFAVCERRKKNKQINVSSVHVQTSTLSTGASCVYTTFDQREQSGHVSSEDADVTPRVLDGSESKEEESWSRPGPPARPVSI